MTRRRFAAVRNFAATVGGVMPALLRDLFGIAAIGAIAYGAWLVYEPAGFITGGALVLGIVVILSWRAP